MPKYVIERNMPGAGNMSREDLAAISERSCRALEEIGPQIQWVESFVTADKVYSVYIARDHKLILVLKGHRTLVAHPDGTVWVNPTGNPGMATGGTGDILTGIIAGLMAQHPTQVFEAVIAAVYLHGLAGDIARESMGEHSLVATDLVKALPPAFRRTREAAAERFSYIQSQP